MSWGEKALVFLGYPLFLCFLILLSVYLGKEEEGEKEDKEGNEERRGEREAYVDDITGIIFIDDVHGNCICVSRNLQCSFDAVLANGKLGVPTQHLFLLF